MRIASCIGWLIISASLLATAKDKMVSNGNNDFRMMTPPNFECSVDSQSVICHPNTPGVTLTFRVESVGSGAAIKLAMLNQREDYESSPKEYVQFRSKPNKSYTSLDGVSLGGQTFSYLRWGNVTQPMSVEAVSAIKNGKWVRIKLECQASQCDPSLRVTLRQMIEALQIAPYDKNLKPVHWSGQQQAEGWLGSSAIQNALKPFE